MTTNAEAPNRVSVSESMEEMKASFKAMEQRNMALWDQVKETDDLYTKEASNGRFKFTHVDPQYQLMVGTRMWGPYGDKWGLRDLVWTNLVTEDGDAKITSLMLQAEFFYPGGSFPVAVDQKFRHGFDTCKILLTSARSKALSCLGFSADVFLGMFDDTAYRKKLELKREDTETLRIRLTSAVRKAKTASELKALYAKVEEMISDEICSTDLGQSTQGLIMARAIELEIPTDKVAPI